MLKEKKFIFFFFFFFFFGECFVPKRFILIAFPLLLAQTELYLLLRLNHRGEIMVHRHYTIVVIYYRFVTVPIKESIYILSFELIHQSDSLGVDSMSLTMICNLQCLTITAIITNLQVYFIANRKTRLNFPNKK